MAEESEAKDAAQRSGCFDRRLVEIFFAQAQPAGSGLPRMHLDRRLVLLGKLNPEKTIERNNGKLDSFRLRFSQQNQSIEPDALSCG